VPHSKSAALASGSSSPISISQAALINRDRATPTLNEMHLHAHPPFPSPLIVLLSSASPFESASTALTRSFKSLTVRD
jgi:hypothetical protein